MSESEYLPIATQINLLFESIGHPDKRPYTLREVSEATGISVGTLSQLRTGRIDNPQLNTIREICRFFDVPLRYFETRTVEECYAIVADEDPQAPVQLNEISFRAQALSTDSQHNLLTIIQWIQAAEQQSDQPFKLPRLTRYDD